MKITRSESFKCFLLGLGEVAIVITVIAAALVLLGAF